MATHERNFIYSFILVSVFLSGLLLFMVVFGIKDLA